MTYQNKEFKIVEDVNYPETMGSLMYNEIYGLDSSAVCVGEFQKTKKGFEVTINTLMDEDGSDVLLVDTLQTIEKAKEVLWEYRFNAI